MVLYFYYSKNWYSQLNSFNNIQFYSANYLRIATHFILFPGNCKVFFQQVSLLVNISWLLLVIQQ